MDWDHLKVALAVSRAGSLSGAAQRLGMDQTTAGRRLTALENQIKSTLFIRSKSGFLATEQGQIVIDHARRVEIRLERMGDDLAESQEGAVGLVRLMGNTWMLERLAETMVPELLCNNPRLELRLSGRLPPTPLHGEGTISLWFDASSSPSEEAIPFCRVPYAAFRAKTLSKDYPDWVQFRDDDAQGPSFAGHLRRRLRPETNVRLTATDAQILLRAVRAGTGHCVLPVCLANGDVALTRTPGEFDGIERILYLHVNQDAARANRVQTVLDGLKKWAPEAFGAELLPAKHSIFRK